MRLNSWVNAQYKNVHESTHKNWPQVVLYVKQRSSDIVEIIILQDARAWPQRATRASTCDLLKIDATFLKCLTSLLEQKRTIKPSHAAWFLVCAKLRDTPTAAAITIRVQHSSTMMTYSPRLTSKTAWVTSLRASWLTRLVYIFFQSANCQKKKDYEMCRRTWKSYSAMHRLIF